MHKGGGGGPGWHLMYPPIKIFEKLLHQIAINYKTPLIFSQPKYPPQKNLPKKTKDPPPWISNYCASMCKRYTVKPPFVILGYNEPKL